MSFFSDLSSIDKASSIIYIASSNRGLSTGAFNLSNIIMIPKIDNMDINYNIINDKYNDKNISIKKYYEKQGCKYN